MDNRTEKLFQEITENARRDRKTVESIRDEIVKLSKNPEVMVEGLAFVSIAENVAKLSDVLTKVNSQLVELVKISVKESNPVADESKEREDLFAEIEASSGTVDKVN